jgi:hypothetical protein
MDNGIIFDIFVGNTILYGYYISINFLWYVERQITPHGLRVMALRSWRTLICHLETPKGQSSQSGLRYFRR